MTLNSIMPSSLSLSDSDFVEVKMNTKRSGHSLFGIRIEPRQPITSAIFFLTIVIGSSLNLCNNKFLHTFY